MTTTSQIDWQAADVGRNAVAFLGVSDMICNTRALLYIHARPVDEEESEGEEEVG